MYACINIYLSLHACLCVCGVCVCVCVCVHVGDKVKQERHEIAFCDIVCRPNVAVNKKTVRKRAVFHCWADARINTHKHNTTHTHTYTHIYLECRYRAFRGTAETVGATTPCNK